MRGLQVGRREGGFVERALGEATRGGDISEVSPSSFGVDGSVWKVSTRCSAGCLFRRGRHSGGRRAGRLRHGCGRGWRHRWHQGLRPRFGRGRVFEIVCGNEFFATTEELATGLPGALRDRVLSPLDLVFAGGYTVAAVADEAVDDVLVSGERSGIGSGDMESKLGDMEFVVKDIVGKVPQAVVAVAEGFEDAAGRGPGGAQLVCMLLGRRYRTESPTSNAGLSSSLAAPRECLPQASW